MFSKGFSKSAVSVLGFIFVISLCIGLPGAIAQDEPDPCEDKGDGCIYGCPDDSLFTMDFRLEDCKFEATGINPFFILKPGYQLVLESEDEKSVETVLCDTKWINFDGRWIKTRVVEERAFEEEKLTEISRNYFAICKKTNAVYYFGEDSRDCDLTETGGFNPDDESSCADGSEPEPTGSWKAGVNGARPGLIMLGTPVKGGRYFQEIAEFDGAVDRGEIVDVGFEMGERLGCIEINDTNPTDEPPVCDLGEDVKIYCPGVGLVQDQELVLVESGFVGCDDNKRWRRKWGLYHRRY
jgi:hypothetical protein